MDTSDRDVVERERLERLVRSYYRDPQPDELFPGSQDFPDPLDVLVYNAIELTETETETIVTPIAVPQADYAAVVQAPTVSRQSKVMAAPRVSRPRRRASRSRRARSPARKDEGGPEPPPANEAGKPYALTCQSCGEAFTAARPHARTCSHRCRQRLHVQARDVDPELIAAFRDICWRAVRRGVITPEDALIDAILLPPEKLDRLRQAVAA